MSQRNYSSRGASQHTYADNIDDVDSDFLNYDDPVLTAGMPAPLSTVIDEEEEDFHNTSAQLSELARGADISIPTDVRLSESTGQNSRSMTSGTTITTTTTTATTAVSLSLLSCSVLPSSVLTVAFRVSFWLLPLPPPPSSLLTDTTPS
jgi:hypothetical protein